MNNINTDNLTFAELASAMDGRLDQMRAGLDADEPRAVENARDFLIGIIPDMDAICLEALLVGFQTYLNYCRQQARKAKGSR